MAGMLSKGLPLIVTIKQPKNIYTPLYSAVFAKGSTKATLKWNTNFAAEKNKKYSDAQKFVDNEVLRLCDPYIPFLTGTLIKTGILGTDVGSGLVQWTAPYAKYQYYGVVVLQSPFGGGNIVTKTKLKYHGGGLRGSFWFERMKAVSGKDIIKGAKKLAGGG